MGTSASFPGSPNGSALIPDFLRDPADDVLAPAEPPEPNESEVVDSTFSVARADYTRWVKSGGDQIPAGFSRPRISRRIVNDNQGARALRRSLGRYTADGLKGSRNAAERMARASSGAVVALATLRDIRNRGLQAVLIELDLEGLQGRPARELFAAIADVVFGSLEHIDDDIARQALFDTLQLIGDDAMFDFENLGEDQIADFFASYVSNAIARRFLADVSTRGRGQATVGSYDHLDENVGDFIDICVHARVRNAIRERLPLDAEFTHGMMSEVFEAAWSIIEAFHDEH